MNGVSKGKIGVVTVLYNSSAVLNDFIASLKSQTYANFELIAINNNSPDDSLSVLKSLTADVRFNVQIINNTENLGVAAGNNQGIYAAISSNCDFILLSNNDVAFSESAITALVNGLNCNNADMAVPKIFFYDSDMLWAAGGKFNRLRGVTTHYGYQRKDDGSYDHDKIVEYSPTCFMLIRSNVFDSIGFMDENYFVYYDDTDFVLRSRKHGKKLWYIHDSIVRHKESVSTGKQSDFSYYYLSRNRIYFARKHNPIFPFFFISNLFYHYSIRLIKMRKDIYHWKMMNKAFYDGLKMKMDTR